MEHNTGRPESENPADYSPDEMLSETRMWTRCNVLLDLQCSVTALRQALNELRTGHHVLLSGIPIIEEALASKEV